MCGSDAIDHLTVEWMASCIKAAIQDLVSGSSACFGKCIVEADRCIKQRIWRPVPFHLPAFHTLLHSTGLAQVAGILQS